MTPGWNLAEALTLVRQLNPVVMEKSDYYLALGGGVMQRGASKKDLDLVAVPRNAKTPHRNKLFETLLNNGLTSVTESIGGVTMVYTFKDKLGRLIDISVVSSRAFR